MKQQVLAPSVEHRREPQLASQSLWIATQLQQRFRGRLEQKAIEKSLVLQHKRLQLVRQGEDNVEVSDRQDPLESRVDPCFAVGGLAFRTMAVPAGIVRDADEAASTARVDVASQRRSAALREVRYHPSLCRRHRMRSAIGRPVRAENVRDLDGWPRCGLDHCLRLLVQ